MAIPAATNTPAKLGTGTTPFGDSGGFSPGTPGKLGSDYDEFLANSGFSNFGFGGPAKLGSFEDEGAFGGISKIGLGDLSSLAIQESTAAAQQSQQGQQQGSGAAIGAGATPATAIGGSGGIGSLGGDFAPLDAHNAAFLAAGQKWGLDPNLIKAIAMMEGGWADPVSDAGALGIMQIMPNFWSDEAANLGLDFKNNPYDNIILGGYILKSMIDQWGSIQSGVQHYLGEGVDPHTGISTG